MKQKPSATKVTTVTVGDGNKWTWKVPKNETDYNNLIN